MVNQFISSHYCKKTGIMLHKNNSVPNHTKPIYPDWCHSSSNKTFKYLGLQHLSAYTLRRAPCLFTIVWKITPPPQKNWDHIQKLLGLELRFFTSDKYIHLAHFILKKKCLFWPLLGCQVLNFRFWGQANLQEIFVSFLKKKLRVQMVLEKKHRN